MTHIACEHLSDPVDRCFDAARYLIIRNSVTQYVCPRHASGDAIELSL